ncbi:uncharacterized protein TM35_000651060 [Trypanosoma theileri]|uniref:Uncharacterized protein n=1 Tax=Trypanosoma theileri TaxID=67003 RepID=A0A1X0NFN3_9TRYP|nr:uncharacterized protein TM35_000651060 [Trypanosoma theileri]ORC83544.1 hypothetical protein TM35_000651060 [Trypanosoma theileri]
MAEALAPPRGQSCKKHKKKEKSPRQISSETSLRRSCQKKKKHSFSLIWGTVLAKEVLWNLMACQKVKRFHITLGIIAIKRSNSLISVPKDGSGKKYLLIDIMRWRGRNRSSTAGICLGGLNSFYVNYGKTRSLA